MPVLFIVHGMGVHDSPSWPTSVVDKLDALAANYRHFQDDGRKFSELVDIVPVGYDRFFSDQLKKWDRSADELGTFAAENAVSLPQVLDWLSTASETEKNFFWSHTVDVLLYRFFQLITKPVRLSVMDQIVKGVNTRAQGGQNVSASVMAHSLGTAVTHDALASLATTPFGGSNAFMSGNFRFANVFMVANVGRILETTPKCYASPLHPTSIAAAKAYCSQYFNFRHAYDPFPVLRAFEPVNWGRNFYAIEGLRHFHDVNPHGWEHYLDHPKVHVPIFNAMLQGVIDGDEFAAAVDAYPQVDESNPCAVAISELSEDLRKIIDLLQGLDDPVKLVIAGAQFYAKVKEAGDACGAN